MIEAECQIEDAASAIRSRCDLVPRVALVLGTGMGGLADAIDVQEAIDYTKIPHFHASTAPGHDGKFVLGTLAGSPVIAMVGRLHCYEGHAPIDLVLPIRVMHALGAKTLILSNASGGLNPHYATGDIMILDDHVSLLNANPLIGPNLDRLGPRFPDMCQPYSKRLSDLAMSIARHEDIPAHQGVYIAVAGPNYETRAEYRFLRRVGDVVGMSTVPEVLAAVHAGMEVLALSIVTNLARPDAPHKVTAEDVIHDADSAEPNVRKLVIGVLSSIY
jgi:purine-nucleoside phosphorylase